MENQEESARQEDSQEFSKKERDPIDRMLEAAYRFRGEERALLSCMLENPELVKRHINSIMPFMFTDRVCSAMYQGMVDIIDRGGKKFRSGELSKLMLEINPMLPKTDKSDRGHPMDKAEIESLINKMFNSDKEPNFYRLGHRFVENFRKRDINRKFRAMDSEEMKDPDTAMDRMQELLALREKPNPFAGSCRSVNDTMRGTFDMLEEIWAGRMTFPKVTTGFVDLDAITNGGFDDGSFVVVGAATGHGKTAAMVNMAGEMAKQGIRVGFITMEQTYDDMNLRLITSQSGVSRDHLTKSYATKEEIRKAKEVMTYFQKDDTLLQISAGPKTSAEIIDIIRVHHDRDGTKVFIVDYIQRVKPEGDNPNMISMTVARLSFALGELARELGVVIIACSQLQRTLRKEMAKRKPTTFDLSESNFLECEASYIFTLYRQDEVIRQFPEFVDGPTYEQDDEGTMEFILCKQRNGRTGSVKMNFDASCVQISPRVEAPPSLPMEDSDEVPF